MESICRSFQVFEQRKGQVIAITACNVVHELEAVLCIHITHQEKPALQFRTSHGGLTGLCAREAESALKDGALSWLRFASWLLGFLASWGLTGRFGRCGVLDADLAGRGAKQIEAVIVFSPGKAQRDQDMKRAQAGVEAMMGWSQIPLDEAPDSTRQVWDLEVVSGTLATHSMRLVRRFSEFICKCSSPRISSTHAQLRVDSGFNSSTRCCLSSYKWYF